VDTHASLDRIRRREHWVGQVENGETAEFTVYLDTEQDVRVTLVWDDPPGERFTTQALKNDLDLMLESPLGTPWLPWVLDLTSPAAPAVRERNGVDNTEVVDVEAAEAGCWTIRVQGTSVPQGPQPFALLMDPPLPTEVPWKGMEDVLRVRRDRLNATHLELSWGNTVGADRYDIYVGSLNAFAAGTYNHSTNTPGGLCSLPVMMPWNVRAHVNAGLFFGGTPGPPTTT